MIMLIYKCNTARIIAVFPLSSASHAAVLHTITVELAKRGHELVVFDGYPAGNKIEGLTNYREYVLTENKMASEPLRQYLKRDTSHLGLLTMLPAVAEVRT